MANYLIYPCKEVNITQTYYGRTSHYPHTTGSPKDYPIDDNGGSVGKSATFYCPCDCMKITRIYGVGNGGVNTIFLESTTNVDLPDGTRNTVCMLVEHVDDSDLRKLRVGQTFKRKQPMFKEGINGATGYHFHISVGKGIFRGNGWTKSTTNKWVINCTGGGIKPENAFWIDWSFTKLKDTKGINFKRMPTNPYKEPTKVLDRAHHEYGKITVGNEGVKWLQYELQRIGIYHNKIDGFYGPITEAAVKTFQRTHKDRSGRPLQVDGRVYVLTRGALKDA